MTLNPAGWYLFFSTTPENNRTNRCNGKLSLHVLDMIDSTINGAINGVEQDLRTNCLRPMAFSENEIKKENSACLFRRARYLYNFKMASRKL